MKHTEHFRVSSHDVDLNGTARPSVVLRYLQETAYREHEVYGPTISELRAQNKAYILSRADLKIYKKLKTFDEITAESWAVESRGVSFVRCGRIVCESGTAAELVSIWALMDMQSRRPCRVNEIEYGFGYDAMLDCDENARVRIPKTLQMSIVGEKTVMYPDADNNRHMNNTVYPDMLIAHLPGFEKLFAESITINYEHEARLGESFKVLHGEEDGIHYFKTVLEDGQTGVCAKIICEEL